MAEDTSAPRSGLFESLRNLATGLVAIAHTRLELISTDVEVAFAQLVKLLMWMLVALFCLGLAVLLLVLLVVAAFWDSYRMLVLLGLAGFFLFAGGGMIAYAVHKLKTHPRLFAASLGELRKDYQLLETKHEQKNA
jgi:uncharacterized membrane protein YqjE